MTKAQYLSLCEKYLSGNCTKQEELLIKSYQHQHGITDERWDANLMGDQQRIKQLLLDKLEQSLPSQNIRIFSMRKWIYAAAAVLLFLTTGVYLLLIKKSHDQPVVAAVVRSTMRDFKSGSNKAVLTLSNGKSIILDSTGNGVLSRQGNTAISKSGAGLVIQNKGRATEGMTAALNTISIPRGGRYDIILSDGTKVWLNASSSLTFPLTFTGTERKVTLAGEAYFEVSKNKRMPFRINVNDKQIIEVLGTHFNVSAYADERYISTTLLEGSVKINYQGKATLIRPGEMAVNNLTSNMEVKPADIEEVMAWKNDMFMFNNTNIVSIMKAISRWYDVDVAFNGDMESINFTGNYSRAKGLSSLLKNIEMMDKVKFKIEGRRITVIGR